jgi:hypothetical protein
VSGDMLVCPTLYAFVISWESCSPWVVVAMLATGQAKPSCHIGFSLMQALREGSSLTNPATLACRCRTEMCMCMCIGTQVLEYAAVVRFALTPRPIYEQLASKGQTRGRTKPSNQEEVKDPRLHPSSGCECESGSYACLLVCTPLGPTSVRQ